MASIAARWVLCLVAVLTTVPGEALSRSRSLSFEDRVAAQRAIEEVFWRHRTWPADNPGPKPSLGTVMPERALRAAVEDYLRKSNALETRWQRPITGEQLQAELDRMARETRDPRVLQELFDALGGDAALIAETLARPALADRLIRNRYAAGERRQPFDEWWETESATVETAAETGTDTFTLPRIDHTGCVDDTWRTTHHEFPDIREQYTAVWTGTEMIVWGADIPTSTGGRYCVDDPGLP